MGRVKDLYWDEICSQPPDRFDNSGDCPEYQKWAETQDATNAELYDNYEPTSEDLRLKDANNGY